MCRFAIRHVGGAQCGLAHTPCDACTQLRAHALASLFHHAQVLDSIFGVGGDSEPPVEDGQGGRKSGGGGAADAVKAAFEALLLKPLLLVETVRAWSAGFDVQGLGFELCC